MLDAEAAGFEYEYESPDERNYSEPYTLSDVIVLVRLSSCIPYPAPPRHLAQATMLGLAHNDETVSCYEQHAWSSFIPGVAEVDHDAM
jgi:hypothetical protein